MKKYYPANPLPVAEIPGVGVNIVVNIVQLSLARRCRTAQPIVSKVRLLLFFWNQ